jgi:peptidoglycan/xylan/chitin deacetylase (PgdA/CDA1 family)
MHSQVSMLRTAKLATLRLLRSSGVFERVANSRWRQQRLLILCYHGVSLEDEHRWRPQLYMPTEMLDQRLRRLREMRCSVLPLGEALVRLREQDLPPRSVAITFDDGTYDFYSRAYPLLKQHGVPVTVYQTTYYTDHELPVFNLFCSYLLWKRRGEQLPAARELGLCERMDLRTEQGRHRVVRSLIEKSEQENLTGQEKNEMVRNLAQYLGLDYAAIACKRILQLMNAREVAEVGRDGVDVQLHTHRHRTPEEERSFCREIVQNRERIQALTGKQAAHFCYPSGVYRRQFVDWLRREDVTSATTCDAGLVDEQTDPFLMPRFVDTSGRTELEFESWLSGVGSLIAIRKVAPQRYVPQD